MADEGNDVVEGSGSSVEIDDLVAQLRSRVEERRRAGVYPAGLEDDMSAHFRRIVHLRRGERPLPDVAGPVRAAGEVLPIRAAKIPLESGVPGGQLLHKAIARLVSRQTQGALQQVQAFAQPVHAALEALTTTVADLTRLVTVDVAQSLDVVYERQAAQERILAAAGLTDPRDPGRESLTSDASEDEELESSLDIAVRLADCDPVLAVGGGQDRSDLRALDDKALGGLALIQVFDGLPVGEIVELVALAADKVRPGGRVLVEAGASRSVHPAYLSFLFREAGFAAVDIEWRSPSPSDNFRRLNELLFAPGDYVIAAVR